MVVLLFLLLVGGFIDETQQQQLSRQNHNADNQFFANMVRFTDGGIRRNDGETPELERVTYTTKDGIFLGASVDLVSRTLVEQQGYCRLVFFLILCSVS